MSQNEALKQQFHYLWLEGNALHQKMAPMTNGTIEHQETWVAYLRKRIEYHQATGGGPDLEGLEEDLHKEMRYLWFMKSRIELKQRLVAVRTFANGSSIATALRILNNFGDPCEVDAWLERMQSGNPDDTNLQQLTDIVTAYIGETDPSLQ